MLCLLLLKLCLFQCSFCFFNLIKCFLRIFLKCFFLRHIIFSPLILPFSLLRDRHFCRKGNPSSDGSSANTFGISPSERCYFRRTHIPFKVYKCALLLSASEFSLLKRKFFSVWKIHKSIWIGIFFLF